MRISAKLEEYLLERKRTINSLHSSVEKTSLMVNKKQYATLFKALEELEKQHNKTDDKVSNVLNTMYEIEELLEELRYER